MAVHSLSAALLLLAGLLSGVACRQAPAGGAGLGVGGDAPWFCHGIECPAYTVVNTTDAYEVRYYEKGVWVSTDVQTYGYALAATTGFKRLFSYIDGGNADGVKIPMTAPVRTLIAAAAGPFCKSNFTVSFYVPAEFQKHPPKPLADNVYISKHEPAFTAFVSQFGGFAMDDWTISGKAKALAEALDSLGAAYDAESFFFAGYDPPFRLTGRHNEIWIVAKDAEPEAAAQQ